MAKADLTAQRLRELLDYEPDTGALRWRHSPKWGISIGSVAGSLSSRGYWQIRLRPRNYTAHRLAWLHHFGEWPRGDIDHINGVKTDNRISNLRDVTRQANSQNIRSARSSNRHTDLVGAHWRPDKECWRSSIETGDRVLHLGTFSTDVEAHEAYVAAKRRLHEGCTI